MPPLSVLMKPSSSQCNMSCDYCFYCDEAEKRSTSSFGFMTEQTLKNIIRKTMPHAQGMIAYSYQGGEPTLRGLDFFKQAVAYQKQYNKNNLRVDNSLQTNGLYITEEWCRFFKEHNFLIGVSIDGTPAIHNSMRHTRKGEDTFARIEASTKLMDAYQVDYNILTVVTPKIAQSIKEVYAYYKEKGWNFQQYIACLDPLGEERGLTPLSLTPKLYGQFLIDLFDLWYADLLDNKQPFIRQFENYVGLVIGYAAESCDMRGTCGIQTVIEADGSAYPCDFYMLDDYCLGNFNDTRLQQMDARRKEIGFIEKSFQIDPACKTCEHYALCRGGCMRCRDYYSEGDYYTNYFCEGYRMFFDACRERIEQIGRAIQGG